MPVNGRDAIDNRLRADDAGCARADDPKRGPVNRLNLRLVRLVGGPRAFDQEIFVEERALATSKPPAAGEAGHGFFGLA
jgi:hypothetical protein